MENFGKAESYRRAFVSSREHARGRAAKNGHAKLRDSENSLGDIAISPETARRNAKEFGRSVDEEIRDIDASRNIALARVRSRSG